MTANPGRPLLTHDPLSHQQLLADLLSYADGALGRDRDQTGVNYDLVEQWRCARHEVVIWPSA